jgi:hypothetical protein
MARSVYSDKLKNRNQSAQAIDQEEALQGSDRAGHLPLLPAQRDRTGHVALRSRLS